MEMVTISKVKLEQLEKDQAKLRALEARGVDNWEGYSGAVQSLEGDDEDALL